MREWGEQRIQLSYASIDHVTRLFIRPAARRRLLRVLTFDSSPSAGASQLHPHLQLFAFNDSWPEKWQRVAEAAEEYGKARKRNYFADFVDVHRQLGLAFEAGDGIFVIGK